MSLETTPKPRLLLAIDSKRCFVKVPSGLALDLVTYLRRSGLQVSPPSPSSEGMENVEIGGKVDAKTVQALLDRWGKAKRQAQPRPRKHGTDAPLAERA
jgi:hypothetical protein